MIDIHSHIMFNIDDGSSNIKETLCMFEEAVSAGFTDIIMTPHFNEENKEIRLSEDDDNLIELKKELKRNNKEINIHLGSEIFISSELDKLVYDGIAPTLNNSRYVLFELPFSSKVIFLKNILSKLTDIGKIPVIAHPERYRVIQECPEMLYELNDNGALFQSNFGSIAGVYGNTTKKTMKCLFQYDMVHFLATDCHTKKSIYRDMNKIKKKLLDMISKDKFYELTVTNPMKILNDEDFE